MTNTTIETIGCDLGDKKSEVCVLDADGEVKLRTSVADDAALDAACFLQGRRHTW